MINFILDTCIIVSALRSKRGASQVILRKALTKQLPIVMHFKLLAEYQDVLSRPEMAAELIYSASEIEAILIALVQVATEVNPYYLWRPNLRDEKDNFLIELAVVSQPCTVITHNVKDLLQGELRFANVTIKRPQDIIKEFFNESGS